MFKDVYERTDLPRDRGNGNDARLHAHVRQWQPGGRGGLRRRQPGGRRRLFVDLQRGKRVSCTTQVNADSQPCTQSIYTGQCLELPVKYRDFESERETGGHPDFFYYGSTLQTPSQHCQCRGAGIPARLQ